MNEQLPSKECFPDPENDLFSDAMDAAATAFHSTRWGIVKNAGKSGEPTDGERTVRRSLAAAFKAYVAELGPTHEPRASAPPSASLPEYTREIGDAGETYLKSVSLDGRYQLSGTFRWYELWDAMCRAAVTKEGPSTGDKIGAFLEGFGSTDEKPATCPHGYKMENLHDGTDTCSGCDLTK